jgi:glycosyltransferase involved in cell wall biosynthesis
MGDMSRPADPAPTDRPTRASARTSPRPVCMIVHAYYEEDARVRRQAEWLVEHGRPVDVVALRRPADDERGVVEGVRVQRLPVGRHQGAGIPVYLAEYLAFLVRALLATASAHRRRRYGLVEVHSLPDFLVFAALPLRLVGVPVLLDLHEAMPEFFRSRFPRAAGPLPHALLRLQERLATSFASAVMTVNDALADRLVALGVSPGKITVILNTPRLELFDPARSAPRAFRQDGSLRLVYAGALTPTYELDVVVDAVGLVAARRADLDVRLDVYGRGDSEARLRQRVSALGLDDRVALHGRVPLESVPGAVARADIGIAPTRRDRFTDVSLSTKLFEYAAMGKPVVASRLPTVERYFAADTVATYAPGDAEDLAAAIVRLADDPVERAARVAATTARIGALAWEREAIRFEALVDELAVPR